MSDTTDHQAEPLHDGADVVSAQKDTTVEGDPQTATKGQSPFAGFCVRFLALVIDAIIVGVASSILAGLVGLLSLTSLDGMGGIVFLLQALSFCFTWLYFIIFTHRMQTTPGKRVMGLRVFGSDGHRLSLPRIILRETIGKLISAIILHIGFIMAGFTQKKQGLHDMIADSVVVYADPQKPRKDRLIVGLALGIIALPVIAVVVLMLMLFSIYSNGFF